MLYLVVAGPIHFCVLGLGKLCGGLPLMWFGSAAADLVVCLVSSRIEYPPVRLPHDGYLSCSGWSVKSNHSGTALDRAHQRATTPLAAALLRSVREASLPAEPKMPRGSPAPPIKPLHNHRMSRCTSTAKALSHLISQTPLQTLPV